MPAAEWPAEEEEAQKERARKGEMEKDKGRGSEDRLYPNVKISL